MSFPGFWPTTIGLSSVLSLFYVWRTLRELRAECLRLRVDQNKLNRLLCQGSPSTHRRALNDGRRRVCIGCSGSVAAVKVAAIARELVCKHGISVDLVMTRAGAFFTHVSYKDARGIDELERLARLVTEDGTPKLQLWNDEDEWSGYRKLGDHVLHIELARRNAVFLVAPLCANTLAAFALGQSYNLLTSLHRAWYYDLHDSFTGPICKKFGRHSVNKPIIVAPAMNTFMLEQNITHTHLRSLKERGVEVIEPAVKILACGDKGKGAMAEVAEIVRVVMGSLEAYETEVMHAASSNKPLFAP